MRRLVLVGLLVAAGCATGAGTVANTEPIKIKETPVKPPPAIVKEEMPKVEIPEDPRMKAKMAVMAAKDAKRHLDMRDFDGAIEYMKLALAYEPEWTQAHYDLGRLYYVKARHFLDMASKEALLARGLTIDLNGVIVEADVPESERPEHERRGRDRKSVV